jgi:hypothetical protein
MRIKGWTMYHRYAASKRTDGRRALSFVRRFPDGEVEVYSLWPGTVGRPAERRRPRQGKLLGEIVVRRAWSLGVVAVLVGGVLWPVPLAAQEKAPPPPVEEWQIEGILAALQDGYPEERDEAIKKLAELLGEGAEEGTSERHWNGRSRGRAKTACPSLLACLSEGSLDAKIAALEAVGHLGVELRPEERDALRRALRSGNSFITRAAAAAMARLGIAPHPGDGDALRDALRSSLLKGDDILFESIAAAMARLGIAPRPKDRGVLLNGGIRSSRSSVAQAAIDAVVRLGASRPKDRDVISDALYDGIRRGESSLVEAAAYAMARLGVVPRPEDRDALRRVLRDGLGDRNHDLARAAIDAMARLGAPSPEDRDALRDALRGADINIARAAIDAMARLGAPSPEDRDALRDALTRNHCLNASSVVEAMVRLGVAPRPEDRDALRDALRGEIRGEHPFIARIIAYAMARLGVVPRPEDRDALRDALYDGIRRGESSLVEAAAYAMARLGVVPRPEDRDALRRVLRDGLRDRNADLARAAIDAMARLGAPSPEDRDALRAALLSNDQDLRNATANALSHVFERASDLSIKGSGDPTPMRRAELLKLLELAYEDRSTLPLARWLAHYIGGGLPEVKVPGQSRVPEADILCGYLGSPARDPALPKTSAEARPILEVLKSTLPGDGETGAVERNLRLLREDSASWVVWIVAEQVKDWAAEDVAFLRGLQAAIGRVQGSHRLKAYADGIGRVIEPFVISPPPWVRTLLAVVVVNVVAFALLVPLPGRGGWEKWLPFAGSAATAAGSWAANVVAGLHLLPWLLGGLLFGELVLLIGAGTFSPAVLRQVAKVEPLNRFAVPLALRLPGSRRRLFREYVASVRSQLERDRHQANDERYLALSAEVQCHAHPAAMIEKKPAGVVVAALTGSGAARGHALIEATGGRGKSALLRRVVERALRRFERSPARSPLPVLLAGGGESLEAMVGRALGSALIAPKVLETHLEAGDFVLVLDSVSETGPPAKVLEAFIQGRYGGATRLLLGTRPSREIRYVVEGAAQWMVVEPHRLDEGTLGDFVAHYQGSGFDEGLKPACRGPDGTYLPILVRMAMTIAAPPGGRASVADIYRGYFFRLFEAQVPDEAARFERLREAGRWCLETYWRDGYRRRTYDASELQRRLKEAGVLVPADGLDPPREVQFFHDSMQSFLAAFGLAEQDRAGYWDLPRPSGDDGSVAWDRARVLLRAAADPTFGQARSDILVSGGSELFQMILATYTPAADLRRWLRDELKGWAAAHGEDLRRRDILAAMPPRIREQIRGTKGITKLLERATDACYDDDDRVGLVETLGWLYAGIATLVYELAEGADGDLITGTSRAREPMSELMPVANTTDDGRSGDVVFVHGLGGNPREYWMADKSKPDTFWPAWIGQDVPDVGVWSLGYDAAKFAWQGSAMPLADRAKNGLALMDADGIGNRPIVFITHSMGGLVVKQMIRHGLDLGDARWEAIARRTKGVCFIATPHSGADLANFIKFLASFLTTVAVEDLRANDSRLRELNEWYRFHAFNNFRTEVYCEKEKTGWKGLGVIVVDDRSADPGIPGVVPIPLDEDHLSICKPESREKLLYKRVRRFVEECLGHPR